MPLPPATTEFASLPAEIQNSVLWGQNLAIANCNSCHNTTGNGRSLAENIPIIANQTPTYLLTQLRAFRDGTRGGTVMPALMQSENVPHGDSELEALANYFGNFSAMGLPTVNAPAPAE